jgi:hypothetical protein
MNQFVGIFAADVLKLRRDTVDFFSLQQPEQQKKECNPSHK